MSVHTYTRSMPYLHGLKVLDIFVGITTGLLDLITVQVRQYPYNHLHQQSSTSTCTPQPQSVLCWDFPSPNRDSQSENVLHLTPTDQCVQSSLLKLVVLHRLTRQTHTLRKGDLLTPKQPLIKHVKQSLGSLLSNTKCFTL